MSVEKKIILVGGGGHCRSCIEVIEGTEIYKIAGIIQGRSCATKASILDYPVIGYDEDLPALKKEFDYALVTVGQTGAPHIRKKLFNTLKEIGFALPPIISQTAHVSQHARIGEGSIVMHHALVNAGAVIGSNCILNTKSLVEHDARVGSHTHISTAVVINGGAAVGSDSFVGSGAVVVQETALPDHHFIKANQLVTGGTDGKPMEEKK